MTTQELNRVIYENQNMVEARDNLLKLSKRVEKVLNETLNITTDIIDINFIIIIIRHIKQQIVYFEEQYGKINEEAKIICRSIRKKFNNILKHQKIKIITKGSIFDGYNIDNLSLCYDEELGECCYIFSAYENDNKIIGQISIEDLKKVQVAN